MSSSARPKARVVALAPAAVLACGAMSEAASDPTEVELRFALVRRRYGDRLTPEQLDEVRRAVGAIVEMVTALRTVRLTNADEPGQRFVPFRAAE